MISGRSHASLWSGTADSWIDLHPAGAFESEARSAFGSWQVGFTDFGQLPRASLWSGSAASWEDLSLALDGDWGTTFATGVWSDGTLLVVSGYGENLVTGQTEALLWTRPIPAPSTTALVALSAAIAAQRRRRRGG